MKFNVNYDMKMFLFWVGPTKLDSIFLGLSHLLWIFVLVEPSCWILFWFSSGTNIYGNAWSYASCMSGWAAHLNERFGSNFYCCFYCEIDNKWCCLGTFSLRTKFTYNPVWRNVLQTARWHHLKVDFVISLLWEEKMK